MKYIRDLPPETIVLIGLSGGKDSTGLAVWAKTFRPDLSWVCVHVRHGLRDDSKDVWAAEQTARILGFPFHIKVADYSGIVGAGPEDQARQARYKAFKEVADELATNHVVIAHSADDQAETILLRIARGTGVSGLSGMSVRTEHSGLIIHRPLLEVRRSTLRSLADGMPTVEDPTNNDLEQRRAYVRHTLIPAFEKARPDEGDIVPSLTRLGVMAGRTQQLLNSLLEPYENLRWGHVTRVPNVQEKALQYELTYRALKPQVTEDLVKQVVITPVGSRADISFSRFVERDQYGYLIGRRDLVWELREETNDKRKSRVVVNSDPNVDPLKQHPLPWLIKVPNDIKNEELILRTRQPEDSVYKKVFGQIPASMRNWLPIVTDGKQVFSVGYLQIPLNIDDNFRLISVNLAD